MLSYFEIEAGTSLKIEPGDTSPSKANLPKDSGQLIGQGGSYRISLPFSDPFGPKEMNLFRTKNIFIYGTIDYEDFDRSTHRTTICFVKRPKDDKFGQCLETAMNSIN